MSEKVTVPEYIPQIAATVKQLMTERDQARREVTEMAAKVLRLDNELIDANRRIETLEEQLTAALAELHAWKMVATAND